MAHEQEDGLQQAQMKEEEEEEEEEKGNSKRRTVVFVFRLFPLQSVVKQQYQASGPEVTGHRETHELRFSAHRSKVHSIYSALTAYLL